MADIYMDYNSTAPIESTVYLEMMPYFSLHFSNASSEHNLGKAIKVSVDLAWSKVGEIISTGANNVIATSGATEAINLAIKGAADSYSGKGKHIITVSTEHKAVLETCKFLEQRGFEVTYLSVGRNGLINLDELRQALRVDTILVSVMYVNNETGVIQPVKEIASIVKNHGAIFMTDATQAVGKIKVDAEELDVDLLCFSGHKMYAPKGIGTLYIRNGVKLTPLIHGGGQEDGLRSGTLNVPGIIALGKACEIAMQEMESDAVRIKEMRDTLENELLLIPGTFVNGDRVNRMYNVTNICFPNQDANVLIARMKTVAVSNGSACTSAIVEPSHVLKAMGLSDDEANGSIRFSLGKYNTIDEVHQVVSIIKSLLEN